MQTTIATPTSSSSSADTHTIAGLIGNIPEWQFFQLLNQENILETRTHNELHELWQVAADHRITLTNPPTNCSATFLPKTFERQEQEIRNRSTYKRYYEGMRFSLVPIQNLITPQWYVNMDYVEALQQKAPKPDDLLQALDFVYDEGKITLADPCSSTLNGSLSLTFQTPSFRDLAPFLIPLNPFEVQRVDAHKFALTVHAEIELKPNYLALAKVGTRYIIINGVHRSLALLLAGWKYVPCVVRDFPALRSLTELGFQPNPGLFSDELTLKEVRPAYISDYLDVVAAPRFLQKNVNACWQVIPQVGMNKQIIP